MPAAGRVHSRVSRRFPGSTGELEGISAPSRAKPVPVVGDAAAAHLRWQHRLAASLPFRPLVQDCFCLKGGKNQPPNHLLWDGEKRERRNPAYLVWAV